MSDKAPASTSTPGYASAYHSTDRASARVMSQAAYHPSDEDYAKYERRVEARKAAKEAKAAAKAEKNKDKTTDDASSVFSFRSLASSVSLLRKSEKK